MKNIILIGVVVFFITSCTSKKGPLPIPVQIPVKKTDSCNTVISYSVTIFPIITSNCNTSGCHNAGSLNGNYTTYPGLKSKADDGKLKNRVVDLKDMPPAGSPSLSNTEISEIDCWIKQGAPFN